MPEQGSDQDLREFWGTMFGDRNAQTLLGLYPPAECAAAPHYRRRRCYGNHCIARIHVASNSSGPRRFERPRARYGAESNTDHDGVPAHMLDLDRYTEGYWAAGRLETDFAYKCTARWASRWFSDVPATVATGDTSCHFGRKWQQRQQDESVNP
jgi:hypothetical protein